MTAALITEADANPRETSYLAGELAAEGIEILRAGGAEIGEMGQPVAILVPFVGTQVTVGLMDRLRGLRLIATRSTGTDHIDVAAAARRGITVANVPDYGSVAVAEHTFALLLALTRLQPKHGPGSDLSGKTLGVIGTGAIGRHVMQIAHGFGMNVLAYDLEHRPGIRYAPLGEVLSQADVITLHIPATPATRHFINPASIAQMKPGVVLINTARAALVDTSALAAALRNGQVAAAGLDVIEQLSDGEWGTVLPNTIVTPHIAYNTREAIRRISEVTLANIRNWLREQETAVADR